MTSCKWMSFVFWSSIVWMYINQRTVPLFWHTFRENTKVNYYCYLVVFYIKIFGDSENVISLDPKLIKILIKSCLFTRTFLRLSLFLFLAEMSTTTNRPPLKGRNRISDFKPTLFRHNFYDYYSNISNFDKRKQGKNVPKFWKSQYFLKIFKYLLTKRERIRESKIFLSLPRC